MTPPECAAEELNPRASEDLRKGQGPEGSVHIGHDHHELPFIRRYIFSTDHKVIGLQFLFTGLVMLGLGGAAIGAGVRGNAEGALIGGAIGAAGGAIAGNVIGRSQEREGYCRYSDGNIYRCPDGY